MGNIRKKSNESFKTRQTYIRNADPFLTAAQLGYSTYSDTAGTSPVDGTGGSPNITFSVNTSSPISNDADFRFVKDASNRQGQGVATDYTIDNIHLARVLQGSVECQLISGTYATGDIRFYLIETTSGEVIEPVNVQLQLGAVGVTAKHIFTFQTRATNTTYRLCIHVASTSASAYTIAFNNFRLFEPQQNYGTIITDWTNYTMTIGGSTSAPTKGTTTVDTARWARVGSDMIIEYDYIQTALGSAANGSGTYLFPLPSGYSIDTTKITSASYNGITAGAVGQAHVTGGSINKGSVNVYNATNLALNIGNETNIFQAMGSGFQNMAQSTLSIKIVARVPIAGWGSNMALSSNAGDGREVFAIATGTPTGGSGVNSIIIFGTTSQDSHGAYSSSTGRYTVPVAGRYSLSGFINATNASISIQLFKNASLVYSVGITQSAGQCNISGFVDCVVGDIIDIRSGTDLGTKGSGGFLAIQKTNSSNQIIAPVETVACSYYSASNQTSLTTQINFGTKLYDTHNAVTTGASWKFTAPMPGKYRVSAMVVGSSGIGVSLFKNGSVFTLLFSRMVYGSGSYEIDLLAGDYIDLRPASSATINGGSVTAGDISQIQISRIGI